MKKIVSAVALASVAFGAFAADLTVKSEIKYQPVAAEIHSGEDADENIFATQATTKDTFQINLKQDNVKINGKFDATASSTVVNTASAAVAWGNANITAGYFESRFANRVTNDQNDLSLIEQNYGAKRYAIAPSSYVQTAGAYDGVDYTAGKYIYGWGTSQIGGAKKLGINPNLGLWSKAGVDADQVAGLQGSKANAFAIDYTIADVLPGKLLLKAVAKTSAKAWEGSNDDGTKTTTTNSGFSFEAAFTHEQFTADSVVNLDKDNVGSFGLYVSPTAVDGLTATLGFTYAWDKSTYTSSSLAKAAATNVDTITYDENTGWTQTTIPGSGAKVSKIVTLLGLPVAGNDSAANAATLDYAQDDTYWAIDARARYAVNDALAFGIYSNLTSYKVQFLKDTLDKGAQMALDVVVNANYKLNDVAKFFVEGEFAQQSFDSDLSKVLGADVVAQAGVILTPAKGATITTGVRGVFSGIGAGKVDLYDSGEETDYSKFYGTNIVIPVSFKCSL
ncbi:hypothetical protein [Treponema sp. UBA3813]|uniref:hypothetical protein n=1 Tax=Treponema sp. UBA3813 TaxID=1947715 RepID=UPI0025F4C7F3|nr:hypothetical protein [Treponema sp. UBA3813]